VIATLMPVEMTSHCLRDVLVTTLKGRRWEGA
jgi:hypothetical protein